MRYVLFLPLFVLLLQPLAGCASMNKALLDAVGPMAVCTQMKTPDEAKQFRLGRRQHYLILSASLTLLLEDLDRDFEGRVAKRDPPFSPEQAQEARAAYAKVRAPVESRKDLLAVEARRWDGLMLGEGSDLPVRARSNAEDVVFCREQIPLVQKSQTEHRELLGSLQADYKVLLEAHGLRSTKSY